MNEQYPCLQWIFSLKIWKMKPILAAGKITKNACHKNNIKHIMSCNTLYCGSLRLRADVLHHFFKVQIIHQNSSYDLSVQ